MQPPGGTSGRPEIRHHQAAKRNTSAADLIRSAKSSSLLSCACTSFPPQMRARHNRLTSAGGGRPLQPRASVAPLPDPADVLESPQREAACAGFVSVSIPSTANNQLRCHKELYIVNVIYKKPENFHIPVRLLRHLGKKKKKNHIYLQQIENNEGSPGSKHTPVSFSWPKATAGPAEVPSEQKSPT